MITYERERERERELADQLGFAADRKLAARLSAVSLTRGRNGSIRPGVNAVLTSRRTRRPAPTASARYAG
jgi:hypothetical protein